MADHYLETAFSIAVTVEEAALLAAAISAAERLSGADCPDRGAAYAELGPAFAAAFPASAEDPFATFLQLFDDPDFPQFDADIEIGESDASAQVLVYFAGRQFGVEQVARLIFAVAKSALPFGFEYAYTCSKLRCGEFGGGAVIITPGGIEYRSTGRALERGITRGSGEGCDGFVLAARDKQHGLAFWNNASGFGRLADASVFNEYEAARFDKPICDDEPEWLAMPMPLP